MAGSVPPARLAVPDGYTLLIGSIGVYAINPVLYKNLKYDPLKDFDLLSPLVRTPNVLVTSPDFPVKSAGDLIAHLKKNPNQVTFASSGIGSSDHLTAVLFWKDTGTSGVCLTKAAAQRSMTLWAGTPTLRFRIRRRCAAYQSRQAEGAGGYRRETCGRAARRSDHGRGRHP